MALRKQREITPAEDYGFFGPDSVAWKVWGYPTSLTIGFSRAVVVEELDPNLVASVDRTQDIYRRPKTRYDRTIRYFALVAFGDSRTTAQAADILVKVHSKAIGTEPYGGGQYDANDPDSQLWILVTGWHSVLKAYEMYGPGRLTEAEEAQYWAECAVAAELQTCDPADVPRSREGIRQYFEEMRPKLAGSEAAQSMMDHLLNAEVMLPPMPALLKPGSWVVNKVLRAATIATMPRWMRKMGGLRQSRLVDVAVRPLMKLNFRVVHASPRLELALLRILSPSTVSVVSPVLLGIPARNEETLTPAQARERYGVLPPTESYARFKELVAEWKASREGGIAESEPILGRA
jgi:uncharacterized protein (DUF2236 family)